MFFSKKLSPLLLVALLCCNGAHASLIEIDLFGAGDKLITRDTITGLDWLDLTQTIGYSYDDMLVELGVGGMFEGFRYATTVDVDGLQQAAGLSAGLFYTASSIIRSRVESLMDMVGVTELEASTGYKHAYGITSDPFDPTTTIDDRIIRSFSLTGGASAAQGIIGDNVSSSTIGNWLIRTTPTAVPLPGAIYLFMSGIAMFVGWRKKFSKP
jgi:hypothetical protein